jgi:hypothetical protein
LSSHKQKQAAAAQQQAEQQKQEDPDVQMQQARATIQARLNYSARLQKDASGWGNLTQEKLQLDTQKATTTASLEASRIASQNDQAQAKNDLDEAKAMMDAVKIRVDAERNGRGGR